MANDRSYSTEGRSAALRCSARGMTIAPDRNSAQPSNILSGLSALNLAEIPPADWIDLASTATDIDRIVAFLTEQGTFRFPSLSNGLFSAAAGEGDDFALTGYANIWVRDNIHIAHAHWVIGETTATVKTVRTLLDFYRKYRHRFTDIIEGRADANEPMQRPHVRFRGDLTELPEKWSHAQNDALGYWLWLTSKLAIAGNLVLDRGDVSVLIDLLRYWKTIKYWQDEDSGHWEETRKVSMSSIGVAVGGLREFRRWLGTSAGEVAREMFPPVDSLVEELWDQGITTLGKNLPHESGPSGLDTDRAHDAALLFLMYPIDLWEGETREEILTDVHAHLMGEHGIRRYMGDSYWCADYKTLLKADERTADFSDNLDARDRLLKPGMEAQWCIFDPILSVIHGRRFHKIGVVSDKELQLFHLRRSLGQMTTAESRFGAYRCPESYFCESGKWVPNDITPLLWTQANLRLALHFMRQTLAGAA
jgi:Glycosyl hydrolases family 15